jgi:hypothetical protein
MSQGVERKRSLFSDEGTAAHHLAAHCLTTKQAPEAFRGWLIRVNDAGAYFAKDDHSQHQTDFIEFQVDDEMVEAITEYVSDIYARVQHYTASGADEVILQVEQRLPIDVITGERGAHGTTDALILAHFGDDSLVEVDDLKYGKGEPVSAEENLQLLMYAYSAVARHSALHNFTRVVMRIHQPRVYGEPSEWEIGIADLESRIEFIGEQARIALDLIDNPAAARQYLVPGDKQCRWCPVKATCPAKVAQVMSAFEDANESPEAGGVPVEAQPDDRLAEHMALADQIEDWIKAVRAEVERRLLDGKAVPGYKLVEGRRGARRWSDATWVEQWLTREKKLDAGVVYEPRELKSPAKMEKTMSKAFPHLWLDLQARIEQKDGLPSVAPESDTRPTWNPPSAESFDSFDASDLC